MSLSNISPYLHGGLPPPDPEPVTSYDINLEYLSSDAVANFMLMADSNHDNHLSTQELANFINNQFPRVDDENGEQMFVGAEVIQSLLPQDSNYESLTHFEVFFIIGLHCRVLGENSQIEYSYQELVNHFNVHYGGNTSHTNPNNTNNDNNDNNDNNTSGGKKRKSRKTKKKRTKRHIHHKK